MKSDDYLNISEIVKTYTGMSLIYPDALKNKTTEEITKLHEDEQDFKNNIYGISDEQLESGYKLQEELIKCCGLALIDCNKADNTYYLHRKQITSFFNDSEWDCPKKFKISNHEDDNKQPEPQKGSEVDFKKEYSKGSDFEKQNELYNPLDIGIAVDIVRKKIYVSGHKSPYKWNEIFGTNNNHWKVIDKLAKNKGVVSEDNWKDVFHDLTYSAIQGHVTRAGKVLQDKLNLNKNPLSAGVKSCSSKFKSFKIDRNINHDAMNKVNPNQDAYILDWLKDNNIE